MFSIALLGALARCSFTTGHSSSYSNTVKRLSVSINGGVALSVLLWATYVWLAVVVSRGPVVSNGLA